jgi:hypothetical protein
LVTPPKSLKTAPCHNYSVATSAGKAKGNNSAFYWKTKYGTGRFAQQGLHTLNNLKKVSYALVVAWGSGVTQ